MKAGTFDPYPSHSVDPYNVKIQRPVQVVNKSGKTFMPSAGPKSAPVSSIVNYNVVKYVLVSFLCCCSFISSTRFMLHSFQCGALNIFVIVFYLTWVCDSFYSSDFNLSFCKKKNVLLMFLKFYYYFFLNVFKFKSKYLLPWFSLDNFFSPFL